MTCLQNSPELAATNLNSVRRFFAEGDTSVDATLVDNLRSRLQVVLDILDQILSHQNYMAGEVRPKLMMLK